MSGVMTKVAVYAFVRILFDLAGPPQWWWSVLVLALGAATAFIGVLQALMQHDLKRLLAYHTVENIGIIFIGLGLALAFKAAHLEWAAALAMTGALFHVFNHSLFKSLLFFGAGAAISATGERDMEHLGGLIRRMPQTAFAFLVGCVAISALPPLNGFVSEWMTFQAILLSPRLDAWALKLVIPAAGALLALSAALAAACFVKAFGVTFLGRARTPAAEEARETDRFSRAAMFLFAGLCLLAGVLPGYVIDALAPARAPDRWGADADPGKPGLALHRSNRRGAQLLQRPAGAGLHRRVGQPLRHRHPPVRFPRRAPCAGVGLQWRPFDPSPATQYTAGSFAQPIRRVFGTLLLGVRGERRHAEAPGDIEAGQVRDEVEFTTRSGRRSTPRWLAWLATRPTA